MTELEKTYLVAGNIAKAIARGEWKKIIEQRREFEMRIKYSPNGETIITTEEIK